MDVSLEFLITVSLAFSTSLAIYVIISHIILRTNAQHAISKIGLFSLRLFDRVFFFLVSTFIFVFSALSVLRYLSFNSGADLGLYDQLIWNSLQGRLFENSLLGDAPFYLGKSFSPFLAAFVPLYALWSNPSILLVLQTMALGVTAFPIYWFARARLGRALALALGLAYLLSPGVESISLVDVHGIAFATPTLAFATYFLLRQRYKEFLVCLGLASLIREEIALIVIAVGAYILLFQRQRWFGLAVSLFGCVLSVMLLIYVIPFLRGPEFGATFYYFGSGFSGEAQSRYTYLGHSLPEIINTLITRPDTVLQHVLIPEKIEFVLHLLVPLGFLPLIGVEILVLALPTLGYSLLSDYSFQYSIHSFYFAPLVPFLFFATAVGAQRLVQLADRTVKFGGNDQAKRIDRRAMEWALGALILVATGSSYYFQAPGPLAQNFQPERYVLDSHTTTGNNLMRLIPDDAVVVAQTELVAHLSQRRLLYDFPAVPDYRQADYICADTTRFWYDFHRASWDSFLGTDYFAVVAQQDGFLIAKRRPTDHPLQIRYGNQMTLLGYTLVPTETVRGGMTLRPIVLWHAEETVPERYAVTVQVVDAQGHIWAQEDREPDAGFSPTNRWEAGKTVGDQYDLRLPPTMPRDDYKITIAVHKNGEEDYLDAYDEQDHSLGTDPEVASVRIEKNKSSFTASQLWIEQPFSVDMQELRLLGYVLPRRNVRPGEMFHLGIYWRARGKPRGDYIVTVQLRDATDRVVVEQSSHPANGTYPTSLWDLGEVLLDWHDFDLPKDMVYGEYKIFVVLRDSESQQVLAETPISTISIVH